MSEGRGPLVSSVDDATVALPGVIALDAQQPEPNDPVSESRADPGTPSTPDPDPTPDPRADPAPGAAGPAPGQDPAPGAAPGPTPGSRPGAGPKTRSRKPKPPGVREQLVKTFAAGMDLAKSHVELAKVEASEIGREGGRFAGFIGAALALVLVAALLGIIGTSLFVGEWLFGSIGWGVLHGVLAFLSIAVALVLLALGVSAVRIGRALVVAVVVGVLVSVVLGLDLLNQAYASIGSSLGLAVDPAVRPLVVGLGLGAIVGLVLGIVIAARASHPNWVGAVVGGILLGALTGAITSITFSPQVGTGIGITVGYLTWAGLMALDVSRTGIDMEALKARFTPTQTIETSKETLEWLQQRMPRGNGS